MRLDSYLWGFLKSCVFKDNSRAIGQLKVKSETVTGDIKEVTLQKVVQNVIARVQCCTEEAGHHFQHLM
jgi:hypothetical protein